MTTRELARAMRRSGACRDAVRWFRKQKSPAAAWNSCRRCTWMVWVLDRLLPDKVGRWHKRLPYAKCARSIRRRVSYRRLLELTALRLLDRKEDS